MHDLRVVIPALNEEDSVGEVVRAVRDACPGAEVIVVDDGSQDNTAAIARYSGAEVISNPTNMGYGRALKTGFAYRRDGNGAIKYLSFLDADATYPPGTIAELYAACQEQGLDIAIGSRFLGKNSDMPRVRKIGNSLFASMLSLYSGRKVSDTGSGLRVFRASLAPGFESLPDGLSFTPAMTSELAYGSIRYAEIPMDYRERQGESKLSSVKDGYRFMREILQATRRHRPVRFYLTLGIPFVIVDWLVRRVRSRKRRTA